jgi:hypothetical protein
LRLKNAYVLQGALVDKYGKLFSNFSQ